MQYISEIKNVQLKLLYFLTFAGLNSWTKFETLWFKDHGVEPT
jgi:hypothetical protein